MSKEKKIKAKTISVLANEYGVHISTMNKWLRIAGLLKPKSEGRIYTPKEIKKIYDHLGDP